MWLVFWGVLTPTGPKPTILYSNYRFVLELYLPLPKNMDWPAAMANKCLGFCLAFEDWWCQYEATVLVIQSLTKLKSHAFDIRRY